MFTYWKNKIEVCDLKIQNLNMVLIFKSVKVDFFFYYYYFFLISTLHVKVSSSIYKLDDLVSYKNDYSNTLEHKHDPSFTYIILPHLLNWNACKLSIILKMRINIHTIQNKHLQDSNKLHNMSLWSIRNYSTLSIKYIVTLCL